MANTTISEIKFIIELDDNKIPEKRIEKKLAPLSN